MKYIYFLLFIFLGAHLMAQEKERVEVEGLIVVPTGFTAAGIHVFNKNSGRGSVSGTEGEFTIEVKEQDSLYLSGLQFRERLIVINAEVIQSKRVVVEVQLGINELPEVVLRDHDLTGNLKSDSDNIEVVALNLPTKSAFLINDYDYEFRPDGQTSVTNIAAGQGGLQHGANILGLVGLLIKPLLSKKDKKKTTSPKQHIVDGIALEKSLRSRYSDEYFKDYFGINATEIADFISFFKAEGFPEKLLKPENEMDLLAFLIAQSNFFRQAKAEGFNG